MIITINPSTEEIIRQYPLFNPERVLKCIHQAHHQFCYWRQTSLTHRAETLKRIAAELIKNKADLATLITTEMGKPYLAAQREIEKCARVCEHYAHYGASYLQEHGIHSNQQDSKIVFNPTGVILAIMPWNYPIWQVFRVLAPNLMAGNPLLLKHAPNCTGTSLAIETLLQEANCPPHLLQSLIIETDAIASIIEHPAITGVTLTGSQRAGRAVAALAGQHLKPCVLELGGSDPYLVLADADLDLTAELLTRSRLNNSGQVCIAAKRIIAETPIYEALAQKIQAAAAQYVVGDPFQPETQLGPLALKDLLDTVHHQVTTTVNHGAQLITGGHPLAQTGFYFPVTILKDIPHNTPADRDEIFGPVVCLMRAKNEQDAIRQANDSRFGLGAGIFSRDLTKANHIAQHQLEAGACAINHCLSSDPALPFGGIKESGLGRELGEAGIKAFTNTKTLTQHPQKKD